MNLMLSILHLDSLLQSAQSNNSTRTPADSDTLSRLDFRRQLRRFMGNAVPVAPACSFDFNDFSPRDNKYQIYPGLYPATASSQLEENAINNIHIKIQKKSGYYCGSDATKTFLKYHCRRKSSTNPAIHHRDVFDPEYFLSLLRNQQVAILGDSLGRQLYHALDVDLAAYETYGHNGNGTHISYFYHCNMKHVSGKPLCGMLQPKPNKYFAAIRYYQAHNVTLLFCNDAKLVTLNKASDPFIPNTVDDPRKFCGERAITSDIIILAVGAWYKPDLSKGIRSIERYRSELQYMAHKLNHDIVSARMKLYNAMGMNNPRICCPHKKRFNRDCCYSHGDGLLWTNKSLSAEWPYVLNKVLDSFLDIFEPLQIQCHIDSLHWCAGGLERAANLLLQDAVESLLSPRSAS
eukprot:gene29922-39093_t